MNDLLKTQMQETGQCRIDGKTVLEVADIVSSLGLDPRSTRVIGYHVSLEVTNDRLAGGQSVTLR